VSAWARAERLATLGLALAWLAGPAASRGLAAAQEAVQEPYARGDLGAALEAARGLEDPILRAEWAFHLLHRGGDLPGALQAAREGLEHAPSHAGLLKNAAVGALGLSRGPLALELTHRLVHDADLSALGPDQAQAFRERALELEHQAQELVALDRRAELGQRRARWTVAALAGLCLALLTWMGLARSGRARPPSV
jgi:hypothetical protein